MKVTLDERETTDGRVVLKYIDCYYTVEDHSNDPLIHVIARDEQRQPYHVRVEGFAPYLCVPRDERTIDEWDELVSHDHRVVDVRPSDSETLRGSDVVKVETQLPKHVGEIRDDFDDPLEADVQFPTRFLVDMGIEQCFSVPADGDSRRITPDEITAIEGGETAHIDVDPHTLYFDIEVQQSTDGPAVVSERGTELAMNPITAIAAYDNYTDESHVWLLVHDSWDEEDGAAARKGARDADDDAFVWLYGTERELLQEFCQWVADRRFDVVTGWNSNGFDVPYLVNRCIKEKEIVEIYNWSPTRDVETMNGEGKWINSDLKGVILFDMLDGFEKTEYTELDSFALDDVAAEVVDATKVDVGHIDDAWANRPHDFAKYVLRDTLLVREIDETRGILVGESQ